jgi:F-type H+-transporting ATPase subunit delta
VKGTESSAARRYARVLLSLSLESGESDRLRGELQEAARTLERHAELREALTHPILSAERKRGLVDTVWGAQASQWLVRLLALLAGRNRVGLLPAIAEAFSQQWNVQRGVLSAEVASAVSLDERQVKALQATVEQVVGKPVELSCRVDPALLGGIRLCVAGRVYDGSIRGRLQMLRQRLTAEAPGR